MRPVAPAVLLALLGAAAVAAEACPSATPGFADPPGLTCRTDSLALIPTYQSVSVELPLPPLAAPADAPARFRRAGARVPWRAAYPLWADPRRWIASERPFSPDIPPSWRGSVVGLTPGTAWEVQVLAQGPAGPELHCGTVETWPDAPPEGPVTDLGAVVATDPERPAVVIGPELAGAPEAWRVVTGRSVTGGSANVLLDAPYVILRGLRLADGAHHGVQLGPNARHVVIEDNEISGWGRIKPGAEAERFGVNWDSAVFADRDAPAEFVTVQRNLIRAPRSDANSWDQYAPTPRENRPHGHCTRGPDHPDGPRCHPEGPQGVSFRGNPGGRNVIRWNRIESTPDRMFNDGMGGQISSVDAGGFPGPHSDIHDNVVSHFYDDGIEVDNGGRQIRVWGNRVFAMAGDPGVRGGHSGVSVSPVAIGPLYAWRNVLVRHGSGAHGSGRLPSGGRIDHFGFAVKSQEFAPPLRGGLQVWIGNSFVGNPQADSPSGAMIWSGGFVSPGEPGTTRVRPVRAINNAVQAHRVGMADHALPENEVRHNAFSAPPLDGPPGAGNRILPPVGGIDPAAFGSDWEPLAPALRAGGTPVANFADCHVGQAPDIGAVQGP